MCRILFWVEWYLTEVSTMNIKGVRVNLWSQGMKVLFSPLRVRKSYSWVSTTGNSCQSSIHIYWLQRSCGRGNVFTGVCLSTGGEGCLPQCMLGCHTHLDQADPPGPGRPPPEADSSIRSTSGRYASYWNAFLLTMTLNRNRESLFCSWISIFHVSTFSFDLKWRY